MTADSASREDVRNKVADLLDAALVPGLVDRLYRYESDNVETGSKHAAIAVVSGGTKRQASGINDQRWRNVFLVQVLVFVDKANVLVENQGGSNWTSLDVENKLDRLDKAIADVIANNRGNSAWSFIDYADEYSTIVDGSERPYETPDTQQTKWKVESYTLVVDYIEKGAP